MEIAGFGNHILTTSEYALTAAKTGVDRIIPDASQKLASTPTKLAESGRSSLYGPIGNMAPAIAVDPAANSLEIAIGRDRCSHTRVYEFSPDDSR